MHEHPPVLGIDYGTTNTAAAWCDATGKLHLVPVTDQSYILPSVVWFRSREQSLVGHVARPQIVDDPVHTVHAGKRFIGRRFRSEFVTHHRDRFVFPVVEDELGHVGVEVYGEVTSLTEVAFLVITRMVELANAAAGFEFESAVLTVPSHFGFSQRRAVRTAAEMAGLEVRAVINEPTAAALFYGRHQTGGAKVMVFDLGGGTLDVTLLEIERREVRVLGSGGDPFLGGYDFDDAVVARIVEHLKNSHQVDVTGNRVVMQRLHFAAETAKIELTRGEESRIRVPFVAQKGERFVDVDYRLTRRELESVTEGLVARCLGIVDDVLEQTGVAPAEVAEVIFVGGQTRMPAVRKRVATRLHYEPAKHQHPELGVAIGAAILGRTLDLPRGPALIDVVPAPIGVMSPAIGSVEVIGRNATVPVVARLDVQRPPPGQPLAFAMYEAFDVGSVDRDLLGMATVPPEWLESTEGNLELEVRLGFDFDLTLGMSSESGGLPLELRPPPRS